MSSPSTSEPKPDSLILRWLKASKAWYKLQSWSFKFYMLIILISISTHTIITISDEIIRLNFIFILVVLTIAIICSIYFALGELVPKPQGFKEALREARKDQLVDSAMRNLETEPPQTLKDMALSIQGAMTTIVNQRRLMPWKRLVKVIIRVGSILYILSYYIKVLVLASSNERFGLKATSQYWEYFYSSILAVITFGHGIVHDSDFQNPLHKSLFLTFISILSVLILGMGVNLLANSLDESNFINLTYHALRTYLESIMGEKTVLSESTTKEAAKD
jgi:undecaprenyl pyrophosphate phosphatase UppP